MKLMIELPDDAYNELKERNCNGWLTSKEIECMHKAIVNGTPLPNGHGRLIDADKLDRIMYHKAFETDSDMQKWDSGCWIRYKMFENSMKEVPTIVEPN